MKKIKRALYRKKFYGVFFLLTFVLGFPGQVFSASAGVQQNVTIAQVMDEENLPASGLNANGTTDELPDGDVNALLNSFAAAVAAGSKTFSVPPAVYRFSGAFTINNVHNMEINGQGSTFIFKLRSAGIRIISCSNLTLKNLFLDMENPPFIQGTIQAINHTNKTIDFSVDDGFLSESLATANHRYVILDPQGKRELPLPDATGVPPPVKLESGLLRGNPTRLFSTGVNFDIGYKIVVNMRGTGGGVKLEHSSSITLEDVVVYATGSFAFHESGRSDGGNVYRRCKIIPRPGSSSIFAAAADGFHSMHQRKGPHLIDCEFSWTFDDLINVHGFINLVIEKHAPDQLLLANPYERDFDVGDTIRFYKYPGAVPAGMAVVKNITPVTNPSKEEVERRAREYFTSVLKISNSVRTFPGSQPCLVEFDRSVDVKEFDLAVSSSYAGRGTIIDNCHLHNGHVRGILVKSPDATIKNCTIEYIQRAGILLYAEQHWLEGPFADNVKIIDNVLRSCSYNNLTNDAPIYTTSSFGAPRNSVAHAYNIGNIEIAGNTILDAPGVAMKIVNADGVLVKNNKIINPLSETNRQETLSFTEGIYPPSALNNVMSYPYYGIVLISTRNVLFSGNEAMSVPPEYQGMVGIGSWSENIQFSTNIQDLNQPDRLYTYLDPNASLIRIKHNESLAEKVNWYIIDLTGSILLSGKYTHSGSDMEIDVSGLKYGLYLLRLDSDKWNHTAKILINL